MPRFVERGDAEPMLERLIEYIGQLPEQDVASVTIQDAAICAALFESYGGLPEQKRYVDAAAAVGRWTACSRRSALLTEGRRHQHLLRNLVDRLQDGPLDDFTWDELAVVRCVNGLAHRVHDQDAFACVRGLLEPHIEAVKARLEQLEVTPGLPRVSERLHFVTSEDIRGAGAREIKVFAGIDMQSLGPVLAHTGDIRVLDNVPEDCTLVIENGSCSVEGYVMGKVAATGDCEVRENISGTVVVRKGDVRTRNIIDKAYIVAKRGSVYCRSAQGPALVFAGTEIDIEDQAVMGKYISPEIRVNAEVFGGEYHVSSRIQASRFRRSDPRPMIVVLRCRISCLDYGEVPDETASPLLTRAATLRRRLTALAQVIPVTEREAEQYAGTALRHLTGSADSVESTEKIQAGHDRRTVLDLIVNAYASLASVIEERLLLMTLSLGFEEADPSLLSAKREIDLEPPSSVGAIVPELAEELEQLARLSPIVLGADFTKRQALQLLGHIRSRYTVWYREREERICSVENWQGEPSSTRTESDAPNRPEERFPQVKTLRELASTAQSRAPGDPMAKRLQSGYMRVAQRTVNTLMKRHKKYVDEVRELRQEFSSVAEKLRDNYHILVAQRPRDVQHMPCAEGAFDAGVRLYADPFLLNETDIPDRAMHETSDSRVSAQTFVRNDNGRIVEA